MILCIVLSSCNATKFVPEGKYLLNKAQVKCVDDKTVPTSTLRNYLRQQQNTEILGFWKLQLDIYNTAPLDTTTQSNQRLARNAKKMREAPVVYDPALTETSMITAESRRSPSDWKRLPKYSGRVLASLRRI